MTTPVRTWDARTAGPASGTDDEVEDQPAASAALGRGGVLIRISRGVGRGPTRLAAFDAALDDAGVANFNLVRLSSVIPPGSVVQEVVGGEQLPGHHGDLLFCVYADAYASTPGEQAWAGVAWSSRPQDGAGLFVEHHGMSEHGVSHDLRATLDDLGGRRVGDFEFSGSVLSSAECVDQPVCAIVMASYRAVGWDEVPGRAGGPEGAIRP